MITATRTVVIVGAGFSGTAVAINLLRRAHARPVRVVLIDRTQRAGGVAYARRPYPYLLNVPAGRMSASDTDADEFLRFAQRQLSGARAEDFLPRELYGAYLESSLASAARYSAPQGRLERILGAAIAIDRSSRGAQPRVHLAAGRSFAADAVVLALGNPPPSALPGTETLRGSSRYVADPWANPPRLRAGETILVLGTGLTMADVVIAGRACAKGRLTFHALSRRGLIPPPQTHFAQVHEQRDAGALIRAASRSALALLRAVRAFADEVERLGGDWREAIAEVRALAPTLWQCLSLRERRRFLRHARAYWDIHRHRLPSSSWSALNELRRSGTLQVHAGRLLRLERAGSKVRAVWRLRGQQVQKTLLVDRVINCTGPDYDVRHTPDRLLRSLLAQGMARPDALGLGLATGELGALVGDAGPASNLYYVGPMLRASRWETTAVTELRAHAARLAEHLSDAACEPLGRGVAAVLPRDTYLHP